VNLNTFAVTTCALMGAVVLLLIALEMLGVDVDLSDDDSGRSLHPTAVVL
jgi:hypothetical protein